jgi:FkbM family methyltransferase
MLSWSPTGLARLSPSAKPELWDHALLATRRRFARAAARRVLPGWVEQPHWVSLAHGKLRMEVSPEKFIENAIYLYGVHEPAATLFVLAFLRPGNAFVDVGANIGYFTLLAAHRVGGGGEVHAFEPVDHLRKRLEKHLSANHFDGVTVHCEAVSNQVGNVDFYETVWDLNEGLGSLVEPHKGAKKRTVPTIRLDSLAETVRGKALVKIDVEGAEALVLEGATSWLASSGGPALLFECHKPEAVIPSLEGMDYAVFGMHLDFLRGLVFSPWRDLKRENLPAHEAVNYVALKAADASTLREVSAATRWPGRLRASW